MPKPRPPAHLSKSAKVVWTQLTKGDEGPSDLLRLEFVAVQVVRARQAQALVDDAGLVSLGGPKGDTPMAHPAVAVERAAQELVRKWTETRGTVKEASGDDAADPSWVTRLSTPLRHSA